MAERTNPHDEFFKYALGRPETARDFLSNYLSPGMTTLFDLATMELSPGSFVDAQLRAHLSDLLYKVKLRDGRDAYVYMLFEHKSYPEPQIAFRMLKYMVRIWERAVGEKAALVSIVPIVVYHGVRRWRVGRNFQALLKTPTELAPYVPEYRYWLYDLSQYTDDEIKGEVLLRTALLALKYIYSKDLPEKTPGILALLRELARSQSGLEYLEALLRYLARGSDKLTEVDLRSAVEAAFADGGEEIMPTIAETWIQQGRQEGMLESLEIMLDLRFGEDGLRLWPEIREIKNAKKLRMVQRALKAARTPEELRRVYQ
ncbi:MAG: transposase [Chloroflexi bacterium HGW-Chloroflexi-1]|nr:MAG: transposase [Chloroflexi bacterium HGW-Chloroflexi-1]